MEHCEASTATDVAANGMLMLELPFVNACAKRYSGIPESSTSTKLRDLIMAKTVNMKPSTNAAAKASHMKKSALNADRRTPFKFLRLAIAASLLACSRVKAET